jgi:uncharacterized RDD family membrane protein YckC
VYGSFWRRVGGYLIDVVIVAVPAFVAFFIIFGSTISSYSTQYQNAVNAGLATPTLVLPSSGELTFAIYACIFSALYFGALVSLWGSTVGQRAVGLRVVCAEDITKRLPIERALLRALPFWAANLLAFVYGVSDIVELMVLFALLWVAWDPRKQGLHDKLGRAFVLKDALLPPSAYGQPASPYGYPSVNPYAPPGSQQYPQGPTGYPPQDPTGYPTQSPTQDPPQDPTGYPPQDPTGYPLQSPTQYPPQDPTGYPPQPPPGQ